MDKDLGKRIAEKLPDDFNKKMESALAVPTESDSDTSSEHPPSAQPDEPSTAD